MKPTVLLALVALAGGCPRGSAPLADAGSDMPLPGDSGVPDSHGFDPDFPLFDVGCRTRLVSVTSEGKQLNEPSRQPSISQNGNTVVFLSKATNLVPGGVQQVYAHDLDTGKTEVVSVSTAGQPGGASSWTTPSAVSADGRFVVFESDSTNLAPSTGADYDHVYLRDRKLGTTEVVASQLVDGGHATMSLDGSRIAFEAHDGPPDSAPQAVFVHDRTTGQTRKVSLAHDGQDSPGSARYPQISGNGDHVVFTADKGLTPEQYPYGKFGAVIYVRDLVGETTQAASRDEAGNIVYTSLADPSINASGTHVLFGMAPDGDGQTNIYLADVAAKTSLRISSTMDGGPVEYPSSCRAPALSPSGRYVTFVTSAPSIVPGDTNKAKDVFLVDLTDMTTQRVSVAANGAQGHAQMYTDPGPEAVVADTGRVAFVVTFDNLVGVQDRIGDDVFVRPGCP